MDVKEERFTVKEEVVPLVLHTGTFGSYTIQTFPATVGDATTVATLDGNQLQQIAEAVNGHTGTLTGQIIQLSNGECVELATVSSDVTTEIPITETVVTSEILESYEPNNSSREYGGVPEMARTKTFYCPNCGNCYSAAGSLKLHIRACTREKEAPSNDGRKCEICQRVFNSSTYLREHMLRHSGKEPKKCPKCYRKFIDDAKYSAHLESHELEERIAKETGNKLSDNSSGEKKVVKEYTCSFCSKAFTVIFDSRHTKRRYACDECREKYSDVETLKQHKAQMEEKREFRCEKCGRKFVFEGFLQRHIPSCDGTIRRRRDRQ